MPHLKFLRHTKKMILRQSKPIFLLAGLIVAGLLGLAGLAQAQGMLIQPQNEPVPMQGVFITLDKGTLLPVIMEEPISTENGFVGQPVQAAIMNDIYVGTHKVFSRADRVYGTITRLEKPIEGRNAILALEFTHVVTQSGEQIDMDTRTDTGALYPYFGGETTPGTKPVIIPYEVSGIGEYGRVMYHGKRAMGQNLIINPGTRLVVILNAPIRVLSL